MKGRDVFHWNKLCALGFSVPFIKQSTLLRTWVFLQHRKHIFRFSILKLFCLRQRRFSPNISSSFLLFVITCPRVVTEASPAIISNSVRSRNDPTLDHDWTCLPQVIVTKIKQRPSLSSERANQPLLILNMAI